MIVLVLIKMPVKMILKKPIVNYLKNIILILTMNQGLKKNIKKFKKLLKP